MNSLTRSIKRTMEPLMAIVVYKSDKSYYLEKHDIVEGKMEEGSPLTIEDMRAIASSVKIIEREMMHGFIPERLLYVDPVSKTLIWHVPEGPHKMYFTENSGCTTGVRNMPALIFMVKDDKLNVWACKSLDRDAKLFAAPFFNTQSSGYICMGNTRRKMPKNPTFEQIIRHYEEMFWISEFSHMSDSSIFKENLPLVMKELCDNDKPFPLESLVELGITINDLI